MRALALIGLVALASGCASVPGGAGGDGAPARPAVDPHRVPNAVPRAEPKSRYGNPANYEVFGVTYHVMDSAVGFRQRGHASWYGTKFHGRRTSSGEPYDMYAMTAAHKELPLPTYVRVRHLENGREIVVKVNDRGPFHPGRIIDLSYTAAAKLDMLETGFAPVEIEAITPGAEPVNEPPWPPRSTPRPESVSPVAPVAAPPPAATAPTTAAPAPVAPVAPLATRYYLQVGAYRDAGNAQDLLRYLRDHGVTQAEVREAQVSGAPLLRVYAGPYGDIATVEAMREKLEEMNLAPSTIAE